jgi:hypothetical protein
MDPRAWAAASSTCQHGYVFHLRCLFKLNEVKKNCKNIGLSIVLTGYSLLCPAQAELPPRLCRHWPADGGLAAFGRGGVREFMAADGTDVPIGFDIRLRLFLMKKCQFLFK